MATEILKHRDAFHALIFAEMIEEGHSEAWTNDVLTSHGFGPFQIDDVHQWIAETGGKCRCELCQATAKPSASHPTQMSLFT